jgi:hypothetical protein
MDAVHVGGDTILTSMAAIIDTGVPYIIGDLNSVAEFYKRIPGAIHIIDGFYTGTSMISLLTPSCLLCLRHILKCHARIFHR